MRRKRVCGHIRRSGKRETWQVRVRRERPSGLSWAVALMIAMVMVYIVTLSVDDEQAEDVFAGPKVIREMSLAGLEMHMVSLCRCTSSGEARLMAAGYTGRGGAGYIYQNSDGYHVLGAACPEKRDALRIAERLAGESGVEAQVVTCTAPEIDMRITAPEVQVQAIADADALLREQATHLGILAAQVDKSEVTQGTVETLCAVAATKAGASAKILRTIQGGEENVLCSGLVVRLDALEESLNAVAGSARRDAAALSGMLRCAQIDTFLGLASLQNSLAG